MLKTIPAPTTPTLAVATMSAALAALPLLTPDIPQTSSIRHANITNTSSAANSKSLVHDIGLSSQNLPLLVLPHELSLGPRSSAAIAILTYSIPGTALVVGTVSTSDESPS